MIIFERRIHVEPFNLTIINLLALPLCFTIIHLQLKLEMLVPVKRITKKDKFDLGVQGYLMQKQHHVFDLYP